MNKKSREALKNAFNIPEPDRKELFFDKLDIKSKKKLPAHIPMYVSAIAAAVMVIGVWGNIKNLPEIDQPEVIDKPVYSKTLTENYTENIIQTTTASSAKNTAVRTTDVTETVTITATTAKENNKPPEMSAAESPEAETYENNADEEIITTSEIKHTAVTETSARNTTVTTTARHTTTTARHTTVTTTAATTARITTTTTTRRTTTTTTTRRTSEDELSVNIATTTSYESNSLPPAQTVPEPSGGSIPPSTTQPPVSAGEPSDYTVQSPVCYSPSADAVRIESNSTDYMPKPGDSPKPNQEGYQPDDRYDLKKLSENSDLIVIATTYEVIYTGLDGIPYTQENISVSDVLYGDIPNNSAISVYGIGGYIPADEFSEMHIQWAVEQNRTLYVPYDNKTTPEVGDTRIYFLKKSSGNFPDGSYILTSLNDMSKFRYNGYYINLNDESITFNLSELYEYLNN